MTPDREAMTSVDAAWLHMEQNKNFMMIGGLMILDRPVELDRFKALLQERLLKFRRFRQRVVESGGIWWETDPAFHLDNHVHRIGLPAPGGKAELQRLVSDLISTPLDFRRPLWQAHLIDRGAAGAVVVMRIHHCIADGLALVQVLLSMTDEVAEEAPAAGCGPQPQTPPEQPESIPLPVPSGIHRGTQRRGHDFDPLRLPRWLVDRAEGVVSIGRELVHLGLMPADPAGSLKGELSGRKNVAWAEDLNISRVKETGHGLSGTVNDVLLASAAGALRQYLQAQGQPVPETIHAVIPFNLRPRAQPLETLGNQFGMVIVALPVGLEHPLARYRAVQKAMNAVKHSAQARAVYGLLQILGHGPVGLEHGALKLLSKKASLVMTNVPGPTRPLTLAGARLVRPMAWVPQSGGIGIGLSILSYAGTAQFGIVADQALIPDVDRVAAYFTQQFELLAAEAARGRPS